MLFSPIHAPNNMHIPDGFLSITVAFSFWLVSIIAVGIALRKTNHSLGDRQVPLMGVLAAAIFAGQMLNFAVTGGTSGHLLGAALATIMLGPWAAILVITSVISIQALLFQDGGILALGANIFNMAVIGVIVSYSIFTLLMRVLKNKKWGLFVSGFLAAWLSILVASLSAALQLVLSGTSPANIAIPAMTAVHLLIGIGEGLITAGALAFLFASRRDLLDGIEIGQTLSKGVLVSGGLTAVLLAILSPLASTHPDGLEWVAQQKGFLPAAQEAVYKIFPDYAMPGISNSVLATITAGLVGITVVFGVIFCMGRFKKINSSHKNSREDERK